METRTVEIRIDEIKVAGRIRKDEGDLDSLAESIRDHGLINPITVMEMSGGGYLLLAGERRISAGRMLGWETIRATVVAAVDAEEQLRIEVAENEERKEFTMEERLGHMAKLKEIIAEKAKQRMSLYGKAGRNIQLGEVPDPDEIGGVANWPHPQKGRTRDILAREAGFTSATQMRRVEDIADKRPDLLGKIDSGEMSVYAAHKLANGLIEDNLPEPLPEDQLKPDIPEMPEPTTAMPDPEEMDEAEQSAVSALESAEEVEEDAAQGANAKKSERAEALARSRRKVISWERPDLMELVDEGVISLDTAYYRTLKARKEAKEEDEQYEGIPKLPGHVLMAKLNPEERRRAKEIEATMVHTQEFTIDTEIPEMFLPEDIDEHERLLEEPLYAELFEHDRKLQGVANLMRGELVTKCENYEKRIRSYEENAQSMRQMINHLRDQLSEALAGNSEESEDENL